MGLSAAQECSIYCGFACHYDGYYLMEATQECKVNALHSNIASVLGFRLSDMTVDFMHDIGS